MIPSEFIDYILDPKVSSALIKAALNETILRSQLVLNLGDNLFTYVRYDLEQYSLDLSTANLFSLIGQYVPISNPPHVAGVQNSVSLHFGNNQWLREEIQKREDIFLPLLDKLISSTRYSIDCKENELNMLGEELEFYKRQKGRTQS